MSEYDPMCVICRDEAGKSRAGLSGDAICEEHLKKENASLRAENKRLRKENEHLRKELENCDCHITGICE